MEKPFLLIAGQTYYPSEGTGDWQSFYATEEEARQEGERLTAEYGPLLWHEVVNVMTWTPD